MKLILTAFAVLSLAGCASVMNEVTNGMRIDTKTASGQAVEGAECVVANDYGSSTVKSGRIEAVRRSSKDLEIACNHPGQPVAKGRAVSRANGAVAGNIILGGVIGAVVDHNRGTAYTYPTWIEMIFGQTLVFDRKDEKEGAALKGTPAERAADAGAPAPQAAVPVETYEPRRVVGGSSPTSQQCMHQLPGASCTK